MRVHHLFKWSRLITDDYHIEVRCGDSGWTKEFQIRAIPHEQAGIQYDPTKTYEGDTL